MKTKTLVLTAIICAASIFGMNFSTAHAATNLQVGSNLHTQQLSQQAQDRKKIVGTFLGIAAVNAANQQNKNKNDYRHESHHRHMPPPPPPRHHHHHR